jgi:uncharacterized YccA/Bax inhibitor family protein
MSNPVLNADRWQLEVDDARSHANPVMTVNGAVTKTFGLLAIVMAVTGIMWAQFWTAGAPVPAVMPWMITGAIAGLVLVLVGMFAPRWAMVVAPLYAVAKGLFLGGLTMVMSAKYPGIALSAAVYTVATLLAMLGLYRFGIIKATAGFKRMVIVATVGLFVGVALMLVLGLFGIGGSIMGALYGGGPIGIAFSLFCIGLAAMNLVVDFAFIEEHAEAGAPKYMEWVGAFALLVTIVWLYIEILRLLAKLRR